MSTERISPGPRRARAWCYRRRDERSAAVPSALGRVQPLLACASSPTTPRSSSQDSRLGSSAAWDQLRRSLPGSWTIATPHGTVSVSYRLISNGTALVETWAAGSDHETMTVFHPDHADLMLTHYCAQGNQPRLRVIAASNDSIAFRYIDVTNRLPGQDKLVERSLRFFPNLVNDIEVYVRPDGTRDSTTYHPRCTRCALTADSNRCTKRHARLGCYARRADPGRADGCTKPRWSRTRAASLPAGHGDDGGHCRPLLLAFASVDDLSESAVSVFRYVLKDLPREERNAFRSRHNQRLRNKPGGSHGVLPRDADRSGDGRTLLLAGASVRQRDAALRGDTAVSSGDDRTR